ncbi:hypothetical protein ACFL96_19095 [Thermoproteota archaeon]
MDLNNFLLKLRKAKRHPRLTGQYDIQCLVNGNRTRWVLRQDETCPTCGHTIKKQAIVNFNKPTHMSLFQSGLLYALFCENKIPRDYSVYHECIAGLEFIESIKSIEVNTNV